MSRIIVLALLITFSYISIANESIYAVPDGAGGMIFTDQKKTGAKKVKLKPIKVVPAKKNLTDIRLNNKKNNDEKSDQEKTVTYESFTLSAPAQKATFWNQPNNTITASFNVSPALGKGDKIRVYLDGALKEEQHQSTFSLKQLDRGAHTIYGEIVRGNEVLMTTKTHTFYIHQSSAK